MDINSYADYKKMGECRYTIKEIKIIMKQFSYKPKKSKKEDILYECYHYLRNSYFIHKIIGCFRKYLIYQFNKTQGPAIFKRHLCNNNDDFLTIETMKEIDYKFFISYKDENDFIYGFNILSIGTLLNKHSKNNPYTMQLFSDSFIDSVKKRINYNRIFKYVNEEPKVVKQSIDHKFVSIFQKLDSLGYCTQLEWITKLNNKQLTKFIYEIHDIWMYRSQMNQEARKNLCPPLGNPFVNIPIYLFLNRLIHVETNTLKNYIYSICDTLINNIHIDKEKQSLCAIYILTTFTLVNHRAAESLPWLYQSVI